MNSRERILNTLRKREPPFPSTQPPAAYEPVVPPIDLTPAGLVERFVAEATNAGVVVHEVDSPAGGLAAILDLIGDDLVISSWDPTEIPLPGLDEALASAGVRRVGQDDQVRVGLTGASAALAATGSLVLCSGHGRFRTSSLLPELHIAVVSAGQIMPDLESWWLSRAGEGPDAVRQHSNIVIVTGPSRTADIAMQLIMGMHGPRALHLILLRNA